MAKVELICLREARSETTQEGERVSYVTYQGYIVSEDDLFDSQEAGQAHAEERSVAYAAEMNRQIKAKGKTYSLTPGTWATICARLPQPAQMEYHESMARLARNRPKAEFLRPEDYGVLGPGSRRSYGDPSKSVLWRGDPGYAGRQGEELDLH